MSVRKQSLIATIAISGSRVAGLVREMAFAFFFGASPVLDAFIAAFRIPNLLRDLFSEGALSQAFVTVFSKKRTTQGDQSAFAIAHQVQGFILVTVGLLALLGIIFSPQLVSAIASGFEGDKLQYTIYLNRLLFPFILFVSLAAVSMGMLNTLGRFALPQSASTFFNGTSIICGLGFAFLLSPDYLLKLLYSHQDSTSPQWVEATRAMTGMALGTLLGGLVQWLVQLPSLYQLGFKPYFKFNFKNPDLIHVLKLTGPAIIGSAAVQVNVLVNTNFASYLADGSISWLNYAFRLMQFPIGVFGVAIALATAPQLAKLVVTNKTDELKSTLRQSLSMALYLCIPSALGLIFMAEPIISLIYQRGHFSPSDTLQTAFALQAYASGLVFYSLIKIYQPAFLAHNDAKTPMIISLISILINIVLNYVFVFVLHLNHWGLSLGTSIVAFWNFIFLAFLLRKKIPSLWGSSLLINAIKIILASLVSVGLAYATFKWLDQNIFLPIHTLNQLIKALLPILIAVVVYIPLTSLLRISETDILRKKFFRKIF